MSDFPGADAAAPPGADAPSGPGVLEEQPGDPPTSGDAGDVNLQSEGDVPDDSIAVHTVADVDGTRREGEAWFTTDADARTLRWGSEGPSHYGGELRVDANGDDVATVTVVLHTEHVEGERIQEGLETTLAQIKENVEGRGRANPT